MCCYVLSLVRGYGYGAVLQDGYHNDRITITLVLYHGCFSHVNTL